MQMIKYTETVAGAHANVGDLKTMRIKYKKATKINL